MPPVTLAILASVLRMHGADATVLSENRGVDDLLIAVRGRMHEESTQNSSPIVQARHYKTYYDKVYNKTYIRTRK